MDHSGTSMGMKVSDGQGLYVYITYAPVNKLVHSSEIQKLILRIYVLTKVGSQYDCDN